MFFDYKCKVLKPSQIVRSDRENLELLIFAVLLALRIALWEKSRDPCEPRSDLTVLRIVIRPLLMVPCFLLNLNLKKHTHTQRKTKEKETQLLGV